MLQNDVDLSWLSLGEGDNLITAANGSSSMKLICCTFSGQAFAKCPYSLQEKQRGPKLGTDGG